MWLDVEGLVHFLHGRKVIYFRNTCFSFFCCKDVPVLDHVENTSANKGNKLPAFYHPKKFLIPF
jgi:hypothetical protein